MGWQWVDHISLFATRDLRLRERPSLSRIASYRLPAYPALSPLASPAPPGTRVNGLTPARTQMAVAHLRHSSSRCVYVRLVSSAASDVR